MSKIVEKVHKGDRGQRQNQNSLHFKMWTILNGGGYLFQFKLWQAFHQHSPNANLSKVCHSHKNMTWLSTCNKCSQKVLVLSQKACCGLLWCVSIDLVGTRKGYYRKCSYKPSWNDVPTKLVVEGFPQA